MARKGFRADLSGPILAILITVAAIAGGALVGMWFLRSGSQMAHASMLVVSGQPTLVPGDLSSTAYVTLKNVGNSPVTVEGLVLNLNGTEVRFSPSPGTTTTIAPGQSATVEFDGGGLQITNTTVPAVVITSHGTLPVVLYVVGSATPATSTSSTTAS